MKTPNNQGASKSSSGSLDDSLSDASSVQKPIIKGENFEEAKL